MHKDKYDAGQEDVATVSTKVKNKEEAQTHAGLTPMVPLMATKQPETEFLNWDRPAATGLWRAPALSCWS